MTGCHPGVRLSALTQPRTFVLLQRLGRGGFGEVWHALVEGERGWREVAVKLLRGDVDPGGQAARRLEDEARLLESLRHPVFPWFLGVTELDGQTALVSELIEGADLDKCLHAGMPVRAVAEAIADVATALEAAWSRVVLRPDGAGPLRLVHRDIKPSNLRVSREGQIKLLDFGIAWTDQLTREAHTSTGSMIGSPPYMAPERFSSASPDPAADVYALGCVLYEAITGRRLWREVSLHTIAGIMIEPDRHSRALQPRLSALPDDLHPPLRALLLDMLAFEPAARPDHPTVAHALTTMADALPGPGLRGWCRAHPWPTTTPDPATRRTLREGPATPAADVVTPKPEAPALSPPTWEAPAVAPPGSQAHTIQAPPPERPAQQGPIAEAETRFEATPPVTTLPEDALQPAPRRGWLVGAFGAAIFGAAALWAFTPHEPTPQVADPPAASADAAPATLAPVDVPPVDLAPAVIAPPTAPVTTAPAAPPAKTTPPPARPAHEAPARPQPDPVPAAPLPDPVPAAQEPPPVVNARLVVSMYRDSYAPYLKGASGQHIELKRGTQEVPAGTWSVWAAFTEQNWQKVSTIVLRADRDYTLNCALKNCSLQ